MRPAPLIKRIRRSMVAACCLCAVAASPAHALYYPSGPQTFVDKSQLEGWQLCFSGLYNGHESLSSVLTPCNEDLLLLAGGPTDSSTLTVLAAAPRADVIFDTGHGNVPHNANGSGWYFSTDWSWGFAKEGDAIFRDECDTLGTDFNPGPNPDLRLCWHTLGAGGSFSGGYRAGATYDLNSSTDYTRYVYEAPRPSNSFSARAKGTKLLVSVSARGAVGVSDATASLSATASKKKRRVLLSPTTVVGNPPTISVPLHLTKLAKQQLRQKGKLTVKARITFAPELPGIANTQTTKLKIKGSGKK